jgi:uncharacterized membrane protein YsdA (DUF1294 family)/cold shock CspA family protein
MPSSLRSGKLVKWKDDRGFGFIQPADGSQEVFLHISEIQDSTRRPQENDTIYYRCYPASSGGKIRAHSAFILGARKQSSTSIKSSESHSEISFFVASRFPTREILALVSLPLLAIFHFAWIVGNPIPVIVYPVMSLITYSLYFEDKSRAKRKQWRVSESTLHISELLGGWPGGFIAQRVLKHKNRKRSYQTEFWLVVIIHYMACLFWLFWGRRLGI